MAAGYFHFITETGLEVETRGITPDMACGIRLGFELVVCVQGADREWFKVGEWVRAKTHVGRYDSR